MDRLSKALEKARQERADALRTGLLGDGNRQPEGEAINPGSLLSDVAIRPVDTGYLEAHRVLTDQGANTAALRAFKLLRTQVVQRMRTNGWQTLAVTSPTQGNGKTVTAINLAVNLARHAHYNVLLVDLHLLEPTVHKYLCTEPAPGISDYIAGEVAISDILFNPGIEGLTVLPGRESFSHSSEALLLRKTIRLISDLRERFADGFILFDMPPVLAVDDVMAFSDHWDAALLVVEEGRTTEGDLRKTLELLEAKPVIGSILSKSRDHLPTSGYR